MTVIKYAIILLVAMSVSVKMGIGFLMMIKHVKVYHSQYSMLGLKICDS